MTTESLSSANAVWVDIKPPPWWLVLIEGILLIVVGIFLLINPYQTFVALIWALGIYWFARGVLDLVSLFWDRRMWVWKIIAGVLGIVAGWIVFQNPITSAVVIGQLTVWILAFTALFFGVSDLIRAFKGAGWMSAVLGVVSIILAILLMTNSFAATASLPWVVGILAILVGLLLLFGAFRLRSLQHSIADLREQANAQMNSLRD